MVSFFLALYRLLIRLYPRPFREEFAPEMVAVVGERLADAAAQGSAALLAASWHELRDWPGHCLEAHWQVRQQQLAMGPDLSVGRWGSFLAALPHFLMAFIAGGAGLIVMWIGGDWQRATSLLGYAAGLLLLFVLAYAWWRGWPAWSAVWLGYLFFVLLVLFLPYAAYSLLPVAAPLPRRMVSETGIALLWLAALYLIVQRWPRAGLVAMLPAAGMAWFLYLEFVPGVLTFAIQAATWGWLGIVAAVMLGRQQPGRNVWLLYLSAVLVGAVYIFAGHFLTEPQVRDRTLGRMAGDLIAELLALLIPLAGIILLHTFRLWVRAYGDVARRSYALLLTGIVLAIAGLSAAFPPFWLPNAAPSEQALGVAFAAAGAGGLLLIILACRRLWRSRRAWPVPDRRLLWLLVGLLALLPAVYYAHRLPHLFDAVTYRRAGPDAAASLPAWRWLVVQLAYGLGISWLLLAAWATGRAHGEMEGAAPRQTPAADAPTGPASRPRRPFVKAAVILLGAAVLIALFLPATWIVPLIPARALVTGTLNSITALALFARAALALVAVAILLFAAVARLRERRHRLVALAAAGLLLAKGLHSLYWLLIWDSTYDPLDFLWLPIPLFAAFAGGAFLAIALPGKRKLGGAAYTLLLIALIATVFASSQRVDFRRLTAVRAERVAQAIEAYDRRHGRYPRDLQQLTPGTILSVSEPVIIFGQSWCYDSGDDYYRLGYVDREHWSDPRLIGRIARATGNAPPDSRLCEQQIGALLERYGGFPYTYWKDEAR